ncbi:MAG: protoporphyrinogen oxidase [Candidatus Promineifilaceae bacterium]|nr:protoporphyrinogen oxidase [Candidatus Promineifilaceae bacterium]
MMEQTVAIVGGGISGLATAYFLEKQARENGTPIKTVLIEREPHLGGKISTRRTGDFIFEGGPESFVTRKPEAWDLCHELGLGDRLVGTTSSGKNYVLHNGRPAVVPVNPVAFVKSPLLSGRAKLRLLREPWVAPRTETSDESLGSFLRRRIGDEAVDNLAAPAIGSIYLADVDKMSVQVSFERFAEMERESGSLVRGMLALMRQKRAERKASGLPREKKPAFATLRGGMIELVETVAEHLEGEIITGKAVDALAYDPGRPQPYRLSLDDGRTIAAGHVVLATPTFVAADLLEDYDPETAARLREVIYNPVTIVNVAYNRSEVGEPFDGFGVVVPDHEDSQLLAVEGVAVKFPHRAPADQFVLRAFVGGRLHKDLVDLPEAELIPLVRQELKRIFAITAEPTRVDITRWQPANPQPAVGHLTMIAGIEQRLQERLPRLYLTGAGLRGQGVPDCIRQAKELVQRMTAEQGQEDRVPT